MAYFHALPAPANTAQRPPQVSATASQSLRTLSPPISSSKSSTSPRSAYCAATPANTLSSNFAQRSLSAESSPSTRSTAAAEAVGLTERACATATSCAQQAER